MRWQDNMLIAPEYINYLLDSFSEGLYITTPQGLTLGVNRAYEQITGIDASLLVGRMMHEIVSDGILSSTITEDVMRTGEEVSSDQKVFNGKRCFIKGWPIRDREGKVVLVVTIVRDIDMVDSLQSELRKQREVAQSYRRELEKMFVSPGVVTSSKAFREAIALARRVARLDSTVLIVGESGTGKEIVAKEIHESSPRAHQPFIKVNCGTIPEQLLESELFGYEKGAFTGASPKGHAGMFEVADNGTIFLDEIGELPLPLQVKLLRVLQERTFMRVGSTWEQTVGARFIAATNENLEQMVLEKRFRRDLYYRLNVVHIDIPPLRKRLDAMPELIEFFVSRINAKYHLSKRLHPDLIKDMMSHDWPGNVRELEHAVERLMVTSESDVITGPFVSRLAVASEEGLTFSGVMPLREAQERLEGHLVRAAGKRCKTTYEVAEALGISQPSASRKLNKYMSEPD